MATFANVTNQVAALKELYSGDSYMKDLVYKKNALLSLLPKDESPTGFAGKYIPVPTVWGTPQGRSATFTNAQNNQTAPQISSFFVYRVSNYQVVTISNELLEATANDAGAFVDEAKLNIDTGFRNLSNDLASGLFGSGTGSRGQIASSVVGGTPVITITLANVSSVVQFEVGMVLLASTTTTDGSAPSVDFVTITAVNRSGGIITGNSSTATSAGLSGPWTAANTFLYVQGDVPSTGATGTGSYLKLSGLAAWMPTSIVGGGDSFWNVNRSQDSRLQGVIYNGASQPIEEALIDGAVQINLNGGAPDYCFMNFQDYSSLEKALGSKVQYVAVSHDTADISFAGIKLHSPYGLLTCLPDRSCPKGNAYMLQLDTWKLRSLGKAPHVLTYGLEGLQGIRTGASDSLEIRLGFYGNLICSAPGWNGIVQLGT
jgi:hypothetical protein